MRKSDYFFTRKINFYCFLGEFSNYLRDLFVLFSVWGCVHRVDSQKCQILTLLRGCFEGGRDLV